MFGRKKKKQNSATYVDANGKPEDHSKKKKGLGSSPGLSKLFGSLSEGLNKAGKGKEKKSFGGSLRDGLHKVGRDDDSHETGGQKLSFLKSSKKNQAPPPPVKTTPVASDDRQTRLHDSLTSPAIDISRGGMPSSQGNGYPIGHESRLSNTLHHNGSAGQILNVSSHDMSNHGSMYASSVASGTSSSLEIRIDEDGDNLSNATSSSPMARDGPVPEYARRPVESWEEEDVLEWLADVGLEYFVDMFQDCGIDGEYILSVTDEDLVELEVDDSQLRHALLTAISEAQTGVVLPSQTPINDAPQSNTEIYKEDITHHSEKEEEPIISKKSLDSWSDSEFEFSDPELPDDGVRAPSPTKPIPAPRGDSGDLPSSPSKPIPSPRRRTSSPPSIDIEDDSSELSSYNVDSSERSYNVDDDDSEDLTSVMDIDRDIVELSRIEEEMEYEDIDGGDGGGIAVEDWKEAQVLEWLTSIGLGHLSTHFKGHSITGNELLNIDMQLLDEMQVSSKEDRERLLSQLYELSNPAANIPQNGTISAINETSGYERTKFMAAVTVLQSKNTEGIQLLPPENSPVMAALVENPSSPYESRETSPRTPEGDEHSSPRSSPRSQEGSRYNSPRQLEDESSPTPPERRRYKTPTPPGRRKYSRPNSPESPTAGISPRTKEEGNLSPRTIEGSKQGSAKTWGNDANLGSNLSPTREIRLKNTPSSASEGSRKSDSEEKKTKGPFGLMKLVGSISPNSRRKPQKHDTAVIVWTKIGSKGPSYSLSFKLTPTSTTADLIKLCLDKMERMEDYRLYSVCELSPSKTKGKLDTRDLEYDEIPLDVRYMWPDHTSCRFELRQRPAQGGSVKVVFHLAGNKPKGKLLNISLSTPACEVVALGLRKFGMMNTDPDHFCLLEVDKSGDLHDVEDDALPLQLDSHAFVLCDRANKEAAALHSGSEAESANTSSASVRRNDSQTSTAANHSGSEEGATNAGGVRRNDSQISRASSKVSFSGASLASSHGSSSDLLLSSRIDDEKLTKLEEEMANIAQALSPRSEPPVDTPDSSVNTVASPQQQDTTEQDEDAEHKPKHMQVDVEDQTDSNRTLRQHNEKLERKAKQLKIVQAALSRLEETYRHEIAASHKRVMVPCESDNLPSSVKDLQKSLDEANQHIMSKQKCIATLKQQKTDEENPEDNLDSSILAAELDYKLALEETALVALQQEQSRLFTKLELALADHQVAIEKGKSRKYRRPLFPVLTPSMHTHTVILPLHIDLALESHDQNLTLAESKDQKGVVVERCRPQSDLKVGDRLIEVNGENVTRADIVEVNTCLNKSFKAQIVVLREQPIIADNTAELAKMEQQLSLANQQLESSRRESNRLKEEVRRLRPLESHIIDTTQMKASMQQLQNELETSQHRSEQLALELVAVRDKSYKYNQKEKKKLAEEMDEVKDTLIRLQESMEAKDSKLASVIQERDAALDKLREMESNDSTNQKPSALIMDNEEDLPLWEALKTAQKSEILSVLQEEVQEAGRQKNYLDQLYTLMLEKAPELLNDLEEECEISDFSGNEEFC